MKKLLPLFLIIIIVAIIVIIVLLFFKSCSGPGSGNGNGDGEANHTQTTETVDNETTTKKEKDDVVYVKITILEKDYLYDNEKIELDELINKLEKIEGTFVVEITDDKATKNAYDKLVEELESINVKYKELNKI